MYACYGGDRFWPLTADVAVFSAPLDRAVRALRPAPGRGWWPRPARHARHDSLAAALAARADHALLLVATNDRRTAVLSAAGLDHGWLQARARLDLRCDLVWTTFRPAGTDVEPAARFGDYRVTPPTEPIPSHLRQTNELTVDVLRDGHAWSFHRLGPTRPYEEERFYLNRTKADRLPFDLLARYAAATGLPIGDLDFLSGPVTTIPNPVSAPEWSTIAELRAAHGYPPTGVVTSLTGKRPATDHRREPATAGGPAGRPAHPGRRPAGLDRRRAAGGPLVDAGPARRDGRRLGPGSARRRAVRDRRGLRGARRGRPARHRAARRGRHRRAGGAGHGRSWPGRSRDRRGHGLAGLARDVRPGRHALPGAGRRPGRRTGRAGLRPDRPTWPRPPS